MHSSEGEEDEAGDNIEEQLEKKKQKEGPKGPKMRSGVSAEVYGANNKKENFKARFIKKTPEEQAKIREKLLKSFLFKSLEEKDLQTCIDAMEIKKYK